MKTKRLFLATLIVSASIAGGLSPGANAGLRGKILVLGFESRQLNDIQDRLLRETIMRELVTNNFRVASVIEVERLIAENGRVNIRKAGRADLNRICLETQSDYALFGKIVPAAAGRTGKRGKIEQNAGYLCRLNLYFAAKDRRENIEFKVSSGGDMSVFFGAVAKGLIERLEVLLQN